MNYLKKLFLVAMGSLFSLVANAENTVVDLAVGNKDFTTLVSLKGRATS